MAPPGPELPRRRSRGASSPRRVPTTTGARCVSRRCRVACASPRGTPAGWSAGRRCSPWAICRRCWRRRPSASCSTRPPWQRPDQQPWAARRQPRPLGGAARRAARGASRSRAGAHRALDHATESGLGASGGSRAAATCPLRPSAPGGRRQWRARVRPRGLAPTLYPSWSRTIPFSSAARARHRSGQRRQGGRRAGRPQGRLEDEPILVVPPPRSGSRELAERGAIFGARVLRSLAVPGGRRADRVRRPSRRTSSAS